MTKSVSTNFTYRGVPQETIGKKPSPSTEETKPVEVAATHGQAADADPNATRSEAMVSEGAEQRTQRVAEHMPNICRPHLQKIYPLFYPILNDNERVCFQPPSAECSVWLEKQNSLFAQLQKRHQEMHNQNLPRTDRKKIDYKHREISLGPRIFLIKKRPSYHITYDPFSLYKKTTYYSRHLPLLCTQHRRIVAL